jgi:Uma2 family endonuclease
MSTAIQDLKGRVVLFRMDSDRFLDLPASESVWLELLNGEVLMSARPSLAHQHFVFQLAVVLNAWVKENQLGSIFIETQLTFDKDWAPVPDLVFLSAENQGRITRRQIKGAVDLAVEVLSPSDESTDRETKFEAYARFGIPWYWIVDLKQRQLEEYKRGRQAYGKPVIAPFDRPFTPRLFSGLTVDLASLELDTAS